MMNRLLPRTLLLPIIVSLLIVSGCTKHATIPSTLDDYAPVIQLALNIAMDQVLIAHPELSNDAVQVTKVTIDAMNGGRFTSAQEAMAFYENQIPWNKIDEDIRGLLRVSMQTAAVQIEKLVNSYSISQTAQLKFFLGLVQGLHDVALRHQTTMFENRSGRRKVRAVR